MKIGILTYHRSHNYGALLQAIALRKVLSDMGHVVTFIDYWPAYHKHMYALFSFPWMMSRKGFNRKKGYLKFCIKNHAYRKERKENFDKFIEGNIVPYLSSVDEIYDVIVHGSDQIWRKQPEINTYNPVYFGESSIYSSTKISYAASMGILPKRESDKQKLKVLLSNLDGISVRERNLLDLIYSLGYNEARQDLDPTLLLTLEDWVEMFDLKKDESVEKYALYYKIKDSFDIRSLKQYAKSRGLQLKIIHSKAIGQNTDSQITTAGPSQFLKLMYNAEFVFTSSFHGLAFSLLFHKQFLASFTNNAERAASLLEAIGLADRMVPPQSTAFNKLCFIDYEKMNVNFQELQKKSLLFLEQSLNQNNVSSLTA